MEARMQAGMQTKLQEQIAAVQSRIAELYDGEVVFRVGDGPRASSP